MEGNEPLPFDWAALVPLVVHPMRVTIIEALCWVGEPLSALTSRRCSPTTSSARPTSPTT